MSDYTADAIERREQHAAPTAAAASSLAGAGSGERRGRAVLLVGPIGVTKRVVETSEVQQTRFWRTMTATWGQRIAHACAPTDVAVCSCK